MTESKHIRVCFTNQHSGQEIWKFVEVPDGCELIDDIVCQDLLGQGWAISVAVEVDDPPSDSG